jgi:hypothetical protein
LATAYPIYKTVRGTCATERISKLSGRIDTLQNPGVTEKDWILFRKKIAGWQEAYMDRLNKEYVELLRSDATPSEKFWTLDKRIKQDKKKTGVMIGMSRSKLVYNILSLLEEGAIKPEDLEGFSDDLREKIAWHTDN